LSVEVGGLRGVEGVEEPGLVVGAGEGEDEGARGGHPPPILAGARISSPAEAGGGRERVSLQAWRAGGEGLWKVRGEMCAVGGRPRKGSRRAMTVSASARRLSVEMAARVAAVWRRLAVERSA